MRRGVVAARRRGPVFDVESLRTRHYGPVEGYTQPSGATVLSPSDPWSTTKSTIDGAVAGTVFWFPAGTYRATSQPAIKSNQEFHGAFGAVINGAEDITGATWTQDGARWWTPRATNLGSDGAGFFTDGYARAHYRDDVYYDDEPLRHRETLAEVGAGDFFFDYENDRVYIGNDPTLGTVEIAVQSLLFRGSNTRSEIINIVVKNLTVEKFGSNRQDSPVEALNSEWWLVEDCTSRFHHGQGIKVGSNDSVVRGCLIYRTGTNGMGGTHKSAQAQDADGWLDANRNTWEYNRCSYSNYTRSSMAWQAGGSKFVNSTDLTLRRNYVHDNHGAGLWCDANNLDVLWEENLVEDNFREGIWQEVGYDAIIRRNHVRRCGHGLGTAGQSRWHYFSGILVGHSPRVTVHDNLVEDCWSSITLMQQNRTDPYDRGDRFTQDCTVRDNTVIMSEQFPQDGDTGSFAGAVGSDVSPHLIYERNNWYIDNHYFLVNSTYTWFHWLNSRRTWAQWQGYGHDVNSTLTVL